MEAKLAAEHPHAAAVQKPKDKFDSNCITPGTTFMKKVSEALAYYVADRQSKDRAWANVLGRYHNRHFDGVGLVSLLGVD